MKGQILLNLLFWIPHSFSTFHDYARGVIPFLSSPDGPDGHWFFIIKIFEQRGLPWKTEYALNSQYWIYIYLIIENI